MRLIIPWRYETPKETSASYPDLHLRGLCPDLVAGNWRYITGEAEYPEAMAFCLPRWRSYLR